MGTGNPEAASNDFDGDGETSLSCTAIVKSVIASIVYWFRVRRDLKP